jgi:hypothetical protein
MKNTQNRHECHVLKNILTSSDAYKQQNRKKQKRVYTDWDIKVISVQSCSYSFFKSMTRPYGIDAGSQIYDENSENTRFERSAKGGD